MGVIEDAVMAKQLGYKSYGEYMLTKGTPPPLVRNENRCEYCGEKLFPPRCKYCSNSCADRAKYERRKRKTVGVFV